MISHIKSLGIEIMDKNNDAFVKNGKLELQIAKELNIKWRFQFLN